MSPASQRGVATRWVSVLAAPAWRMAAIRATCLSGALVAGCAGSAHQPPPAPTPLIRYSPRAPASDAADEPAAAAAGVTITAPSGPTGRGALARRLPVRFRGWRLSIAQLSLRHGAYLVTTLPPPGRHATPATAGRLLCAAARALADDPRTYRPLLPMSALAGAHRDPRAAAQARAGGTAHR